MLLDKCITNLASLAGECLSILAYFLNKENCKTAALQEQTGTYVPLTAFKAKG